MGTILHEGEYILVSHKITNETGYMGYSVLSHIGINTSKVNYIGSTRHFLTYAVIKDLELPFSTSEWQDFEVKDVRFHAYTHMFKNLILMENDECCLDYYDEIVEFFEKKKKEKEEKEEKKTMILKSGFFVREENKEENKEDNKMTIEENRYIYIATNTAGFSDYNLITALLGYAPTYKDERINIPSYSCLWSRNRLLEDGCFDVIDAKNRLRHLSEKLDFVKSTKGDIIVYRNVNNELLGILKAYYEYRDNNDMEKFNCVKSNSGRYPFGPNIEKEKETMTNNNTFSISNNSAWANKIDDVIFADNRAYMAAAQSVPDKLPDITLEDLRIESSVRTEPLIRGTLSVSPGIIRETRQYQFIQYAGSQLNEPVFLTARGNGKSVMIMKHMLNSFYGLNGGLSYKKPPLKFKLIFGQEHATGRYKTICLWEDGEKTIIHGDNKVTKLPVAQAFAWCYVKRTFGTVSHFKKHVDKRTTKMDGVWYFEGDCIMDDYAQGSVPGTSKKRDIYDAAALAIVTKRYGGLRKLVDEYINKEG